MMFTTMLAASAAAALQQQPRWRIVEPLSPHRHLLGFHSDAGVTGHALIVWRIREAGDSGP
jgi:hypothetical protein